MERKACDQYWMWEARMSLKNRLGDSIHVASLLLSRGKHSKQLKVTSAKSEWKTIVFRDKPNENREIMQRLQGRVDLFFFFDFPIRIVLFFGYRGALPAFRTGQWRFFTKIDCFVWWIASMSESLVLIVRPSDFNFHDSILSQTRQSFLKNSFHFSQTFISIFLSWNGFFFEKKSNFWKTIFLLKKTDLIRSTYHVLSFWKFLKVIVSTNSWSEQGEYLLFCWVEGADWEDFRDDCFVGAFFPFVLETFGGDAMLFIGVHQDEGGILATDLGGQAVLVIVPE